MCDSAAGVGRGDEKQTMRNARRVGSARLRSFFSFIFFSPAHARLTVVNQARAVQHNVLGSRQRQAFCRLLPAWTAR